MPSSVGLFTRSHGVGSIATIKEYTNWEPYKIIVPGSFGQIGRTDLLLYRRSNGEGLFLSTDGSGNIATIKQHTDWDRDWDVIVPGNFGGTGYTDLLLYKRSTGEGLFVSTDGSGNIAVIKQHTDWDRDWDLIVPGNFGGNSFTGLLLYKRSTGEGLFVATDGGGNINMLKQHTDWDRDWDLIVPGNFAGTGHTDLLLYKRSTGTGMFVSTDGAGNIAAIGEHTNWDRDWDLIVPGEFGGNNFSDLLLYKRSTGEGLFVRTDGAGNIFTLQQHRGLDKVWDAIVPGDFGGDARTDLLFYSVRPTRPPNGPTDLKVTGTSAGRIDVSWVDHSNNEDGCRVRFLGKRADLADHAGTQTRPPGSTTASLTDLLNNYRYTVSVVAFNAAGESQSSNAVVATTPNLPYTVAVRLQREVVIEGFPPYVGSYPAFGSVPAGRVLAIGVPQSGFTDTGVRFVKVGHSTLECGKPEAVVFVAEGQTTTPEQVAAIYGVPQPKYSSTNPLGFVGCFVGPAGPFPDSVGIEITILED